MKYDPKQNKELYRPARKFTLVDVPQINFISIIGNGNPNNSLQYENAIKALYSVAYPLKFYSKKQLGKDYVVAPLEGLWWANDMNDFIHRNKDNWHWKMLLSVPDWIDKTMFEMFRQKAIEKQPNPALPKLEFETITEGLCVQIMHIGSYDDEAPILAQLHDEYIPQNGLKMTGLHHEIYLSDPRKTATEKLKTILRQPVIRV